jgi:hypothetical protein
MKFNDKIKLNQIYEFSNDFNELESFVLPFYFEKEHNSYHVLVYDYESSKWYINNYGKSMFVGEFKCEISESLYNRFKPFFIINIFRYGINGSL